MGILNNLLKSKKTATAGEASGVEPKAAVVAKKEKNVVVAETVRPEVVNTRMKKREADATAYKIISHPLISEKATDLAQFNKYIFIVPPTVNKTEIREKIVSIYGVKPVKINILYKEGKVVRHGRHEGKKKNFKKAIITLAPGEKIEVYEGV